MISNGCSYQYSEINRERAEWELKIMPYLLGLPVIKPETSIRSPEFSFLGITNMFSFSKRGLGQGGAFWMSPFS